MSRPRRRAGENRRRLLEAGSAEFGLNGFHGTSTADIAARAGVPQPHLYANFASKQELFLACVEIAVETLRTEADETEPGASCVIFQAFASASDPALRADLRPLLCELSDTLGSDTLALCLLRAAETLLR